VTRHRRLAWRRLAIVASAAVALIMTGTPMASAEDPARPGAAARLGAAAGAHALADEGPSPVCAPSISFNVKNMGVRGVNRVNYGGTLDCNFNVAAIAFTYLIDRTGGSSNDGRTISTGSAINFGSGRSGISIGHHDIDARTYDGGRKVEVGFYLQLKTLDGRLWNPCGDIGPDLRYLVFPCEGEGTDTLTARVGSGSFDTGLGLYAALPLPVGAADKTKYGKKHHSYPAIDITVPTGTPAYTIKAGRVTRIDDDRCGKGIQMIAVDGAEYVYCHLSAHSVATGARVLPGDQIGRTGSTGRSEVPHLHVQIKIPAGVKRCPQNLLLAIYDDRTPPLTRSLPTSGCVSGPLKIKVNKTSYRAGESPLYTVEDAPPDARLYWTSTRNGVPTGEVEAFYGHHADANGNWSGYGGPWSGADAGTWTKTISIDDPEVVESTVEFTVTAVAEAPTLSMDKSTYLVGEAPLYTVRNAAPDAPIYWSSTRNGVSTGESNAFYGHYTDADGNFTAYGGTWQDTHTGTWTKTVSIGGRTSTFQFSVIVSP
jgi:Peptidase family M23